MHAIESHIEIEKMLDKAYASRVHDLGQSMQSVENALALSIAANVPSLIAKSLNLLSLFHMIKGDYDQSITQANDAIALYEDLDDEQGVANAKYNIAGVYYKTDNFHLGLVYLLDCLQIYKKYNDNHNLARTLKSMGTIYDYFGDTNNSIKSYENAIEAARNAKDLNLESNAFNPLSGLYLKQDNPKKAMQLIELAIEMKKQTGDTRGLAFSIYGRGKVYAYLKEFDNAEKDYFEALAIHERVGERLGKGMILYKLAVLYREKGELEKSKNYLYQTLDYCETFNIVYIKIKANYCLYEVYKILGDNNKALEVLEEYIRIKESVINSQTMMVIRNYEMIMRMQNLELEAEMEKEKAQILERQAMAEQQAKVKQDFLSTMSHEIRTPLNAIISIASLLNDTHFNDEDRSLFHSLKFASNNLLMLINDILDFTKMDSGNIKLELRSTRILPFLQNLSNIYQGMAIEKGLKLSLSIDPTLSSFYEIDETKLGQILGNLISNAVKYTDKGLVQLELTKLEDNGDCDLIEFKIKDTGPGIPESIQQMIFESFYQPDSVTTRKKGGSGLGLAIVKKLVELHQSTIKVDSKQNEGSVFYFTLALKKSIEITDAPIAVSNELNNKYVLIAEDNLVNAMVSKKLLSNWGILSDHAINGKDAYEKSLLKKYDFILMDIHMPEMNGYEASKTIKESSGLNQHTPIYALTADIFSEQQDKDAQFFDGMLRKPIEIEKLFDALKKGRS